MRFRDEAEAEITDAVAWLAERDRQAARNLLSAIDDAIDRIETFPASGAPIPLGCRALTLSSYPYRVIYQDSDGEVLIVALANTSRRSTYWRDRLPRP